MQRLLQHERRLQLILRTACRIEQFNRANNTFFGYSAGQGNTTGGNNTILGFQADLGANNLTNATAIGANALVSQSNSLILGNNANVGIGTSTPNSKLTVCRF
jgi:hypothetical protein